MNASPASNHHLASPRYRPDIDGLRAIAVLSVVAYHAFPNLVRGGFVGVDIFFIISGYLITSIILESLENKTFSFWEFYARRIRRIFPALLLVLISCFVAGWFVLLPDEYKQLGKHVTGGAGFVSNLLLWQEAGYFDSAAETKLLLHLWSLGVEEQFYIAWPLLLFLAWRRINIVKFIGIILLASFGMNISTVNGNSIAAFYSPFARFWELMLGGLLAYLAIHRWEWRHLWHGQPGLHQGAEVSVASEIKKTRELLSVTGFVLIAIGIFALNKELAFPGWWVLFPTVGATMMIAAGNNTWLNRTLLANRIVVWVGLISYPLYLWHWPLLTFARILESATPSYAVRIAAISLSIFLAALTYKLVERPLRFGSHGTVKALVLSVLMLAAGGIGIGIYQKNGLAGRAAIQVAGPEQQIHVDDVSMHNQENCTASSEYPYRALNKDFFCMQSSTDSRRPTDVVIGDSHSYPMYFGLYDHYVKQRGERLLLLGAPGCPPFRGLESFEKGSRDSCRKLMDTMLSRIEESREVKTVILVNRGPLYVSGTGYGEGDEHRRVIQRVGETTAKSNSAIYKAALLETIREIKSHNKNIVLVMSPPELGFEPKACLNNRPVSWNKRSLENCGITYADYLARTAEYRQIISDVLKEIPDIFVVDPSKVLCDNTFCTAFSNGYFLYGDNNHFSPTGASKVIAASALPY